MKRLLLIAALFAMLLGHACGALLARSTGVTMAQDPATQLTNKPPGYVQETLVAQLARAVFTGFPPGFWAVTRFVHLSLLERGVK